MPGMIITVPVSPPPATGGGTIITVPPPATGGSIISGGTVNDPVSPPTAPPPVAGGLPSKYDDGQAAKYLNYQMASRYDRSEGLVAMPIAADPSLFDPSSANYDATAVPVVFVRCHAPFGTRVATFHAAKQGTPPVLPQAIDTDRDKLMASTIQVPVPQADPNGGYNWDVSGVYTYIEVGLPRSAATGFDTGRLPMRLGQTTLTNFVPGSQTATPTSAPNFQSPSWEYDWYSFLPSFAFDSTLFGSLAFGSATGNSGGTITL